MRHQYFLAALLLLATAPAALAQTEGVGIGTTSPDPAAALEVRSTTQGLLLPRLTLAQRDAFTASPTAPPVPGLVIYQTDSTPGLYAYDGAAWVRLGGDNLGNHTATLDVNLQDNALTGNGANLGTTVGLGVTAKGGLNIAQNVPGNNLLIGYQAGFYTTYGTSPTRTGYNNHFVGYQAGMNNNSASNNQFEGYQAGYLNTTGHGNLAVGIRALYTNQQNSYNTAIGDSALVKATGNQSSTSYSANFNTAVGFQAGYSTTTGSRNVFIGYKAGYNNTGGNSGTPNNGNGNVALGWQAGPATGTLTNAIAIGSMAQVSQSNSMALGGDGSTSRPAVNVGIGTSAPSQSLDVNGNLLLGTSTVPAKIYSRPAGLLRNMLALAYGQCGGSAGSIISGSGNYTVSRSGPGVYLITFSSGSGLTAVNFDDNAVVVSLYGASPGIVTARGVSGSTGVIQVYTFDANNLAADRTFSFTVFDR